MRGDTPSLVLGIDGGGTSTKCLLAEAATGRILGEGLAGPSNIQAVGVATGLRTLEAAVLCAFRAAGLQRCTVQSAVLGLAGVDHPESQEVILRWARDFALADTVRVENDATLLLAAGTPEGWGLAVIAGTGSIAFAKTPNGEMARCGGWGYLLGDEGSAYQVAIQGLRAACRAHDRCGTATSLVDVFLERMNLAVPPDFIPAVYRGEWDRTAIAGMAPLVLDAAAAGDRVASDLVQAEAAKLAGTAAGAVRNTGLDPHGVPVALAGGLLLGSVLFRDSFLEALRSRGVTPNPVREVSDPAVGAVVLARVGLS